MIELRNQIWMEFLCCFAQKTKQEVGELENLILYWSLTVH
ncbi:hypothetical protein SLEP1_g27847 [Rubroshorea leprosula]|uniref:Uncharacterized protein n=1 Tax=Rubroshorea leprosula TaxID=152421 RepID=A0AAV5JXB1_9ROSI|nr:hypothetical protein SLEP1_g27847 [Rubroshorea leprosula]